MPVYRHQAVISIEPVKPRVFLVFARGFEILDIYAVSLRKHCFEMIVELRSFLSRFGLVSAKRH